MATATKSSSSARDWPSYWFTELEQSLHAGDFDSAAAAARELKRLGVSVAYPRPFLDASNPPAITASAAR